MEQNIQLFHRLSYLQQCNIKSLWWSTQYFRKFSLDFNDFWWNDGHWDQEEISIFKDCFMINYSPLNIALAGLPILKELSSWICNIQVSRLTEIICYEKESEWMMLAEIFLTDFCLIFWIKFLRYRFWIFLSEKLRRKIN